MATVGSIINSLRTSKCAENIEKMKVKLPSNDKFCSFEDITEKQARNLVKEFGQEINEMRTSLRGDDPYYYELSLKTADPYTEALLRVEQDGTLTKFISNMNNQYSIDMYSKQAGRIKNTSNNGVTFDLRETPDGKLVLLSEKKPDRSTITISGDADGNLNIQELKP